MTTPAVNTALAITNPLVLYRALLATKRLDPDPEQHRVALNLQKLYVRLKDYSPEAEYGTRLKAISRAVEDAPIDENDRPVAVPGHPLRRNPLFAHLFARKEHRDSTALTRVLTSHEAAMSLNSPKGLLLHGEVGIGKSMLIDLLADSLPNRKKRRFHFNTFMLETLDKLERLRKSQSKLGNESSEYSLLWLAKDMVEKSPILFLDEFQLPDRASSKILSNLLTPFFQLGGVLIASSNRMPDELAKASGVDFTAPSRGRGIKNWLGLSGNRSMDMFPGNNEYSGFVEVLKARCEIWDMGKGGRDWRRREIEEMTEEAAVINELMREDMVGGFVSTEGMSTGSLGLGLEHSKTDGLTSSEEKITIGATTPKKYLVADGENAWTDVVVSALPSSVPSPIPWQSTTLRVYGRDVAVPRQLHGVAYFDFDTLCGGAFGPADYITMASTFHTFILDGVPVLTLLQKNEARRLITLLDALYEARCKLVVRAQAGPDDLFFPETAAPPINSESDAPRRGNDNSDAVYSETLSEIYQDQTSPFRPNISTYTDVTKTGYDPDEDSDFGPLPGTGNEIGRQVDFGMTSSFTGEDERFAYKRAASRLWEMCGSRWHARAEEGWWKPLPLAVRRWERAASSVKASKAKEVPLVKGDVKFVGEVELDRPAGLQGKEMEEAERARALADGKGGKGGLKLPGKN